MPRVIKTGNAERDLDDLWLHIAQENLVAADKILDDIETQCRLIATQPYMGRARDEIAAGLRSFPVGRYILFYRTLIDGVEIIRILHGARDTDNAL